MKELGKFHQLIIPFFGHNITINLEVVVMTWIVFGVIFAIGFAATRKRNILPWPYLARVVAERRKGNSAPPLPAAS